MCIRQSPIIYVQGLNEGRGSVSGCLRSKMLSLMDDLLQQAYINVY